MSTTAEQIVATAAVKLAAMAPTRAANEFFLEHDGNTRFEDDPKSKRDGFEIVEREYTQGQGFGFTGQAERQFYMVVRLGHAPVGKARTREANRMADVERIVDVFEHQPWPTGTLLVLYERSEVNKDKANWWITEVLFKVVYVGDIRT
jgi:hypothetical protein